MNTITTKFFLLLGVTMMTIMAWTSLAAAKDGKSYTGLMCSDQHGPASAQSQVKYAVSGAVYNPTTHAVKVRCLIVKDDTSGHGGIDQVTVHYTDLHPTQQLACSVEARNSNPKRSRMKKVIESSPKGVRIGSMTMYGPTITKSSKFAYYVMTCTLPPKANATKIGALKLDGSSMLHSYAVTEHGKG